MLNVTHRAILHDEKAYTDPHSFNPERFLKDGQINPEVQDPEVACFGYGRRICPGRNMATESMWITIATTLATLTISKAKGPDGQPITPKGEYFEGFLWYVPCSQGATCNIRSLHTRSYPKSYECEISPRSAEHKAQIEVAASDLFA